MKDRCALLLGMILFASGCTSQVRVVGEYDAVYAAARDAMLGADFRVEEWAKGTVGEQPSEGRIDFYSVEAKNKFEPRRYVTMTIEPHGDAESTERTIAVRGWQYFVLSFPTGGLWKWDADDIEERAVVALRDAFELK